MNSTQSAKISGMLRDPDPASAGVSGKPKSGWKGRPPSSLKFGNPARLFRLLAEVFYPIRILRHLVLPLVAIAGYGAAFNWYPYLENVSRIDSGLAFWQSMLIGAVFAGLFGKVTQGIVMGHYGADTDEIGIKLSFGVIPRFYIFKAPIRQLDYKSQRVCYSSSMLFRLSMFAIGILIWLMLRRTGSGLADAMLTIGSVNLATFLFTVNPLIPEDGYRWLSAFLERPKLREHAFMALGLVLTFKALPSSLRWSEFWILMSYAFMSLAFTSFLVYSIMTTMAYALEAQFHGVGVAIFCVLMVGFGMFLLAIREKKATRSTRAKARRQSDLM